MGRPEHEDSDRTSIAKCDGFKNVDYKGFHNLKPNITRTVSPDLNPTPTSNHV